MADDRKLFALPARKRETDVQITTIQYMLPALNESDVELLYRETVRLYRKRLC